MDLVRLFKKKRRMDVVDEIFIEFLNFFFNLMYYGIIVLGPSGSGKTTLCQGLK